MTYLIHSMSLDLAPGSTSKGANATVAVSKPATEKDGWVSINVNFGIKGHEQMAGEKMELQFRQRAKELLLEAANAL